jgi:diaminopimelate decarboxylase
MLGHPELLPVGIHLHLGTGIQSIETYVQAVQEVIAFSEKLKATHGIAIEHFDLGGGFGVPTVRGMTEWDLRMISLGYAARMPNPVGIPTPADYAAALSPLLEKLSSSNDGKASQPRVVFEPGRAITSSSQTLLLSILAKKPGLDGKEFLIADGGKNITMPLGWETHRIFAANKMNDEATLTYNIFGPLCHPGDVVAKNLTMPPLGAADCLAIMDAGAYFVPNQMNFSNPRPPIVSVSDGVVTLVRQKEEFEDIVRLDRSG